MDSIRQSLGTCPQHNVLFNEWVFLYFQSWVVVNTFEIFVDLLIGYNLEESKEFKTHGSDFRQVADEKIGFETLTENSTGAWQSDV